MKLSQFIVREIAAAIKRLIRASRSPRIQPHKLRKSFTLHIGAAVPSEFTAARPFPRGFVISRFRRLHLATPADRARSSEQAKPITPLQKTLSEPG